MKLPRLLYLGLSGIRFELLILFCSRDDLDKELSLSCSRIALIGSGLKYKTSSVSIDGPQFTLSIVV
jgi:hypothetical protein